MFEIIDTSGNVYRFSHFTTLYVANGVVVARGWYIVSQEPWETVDVECYFAIKYLHKIEYKEIKEND